MTRVFGLKRLPLLSQLSIRASSGTSSLYGVYTAFKPMDSAISRLKLHLEENPNKFDEYVRQGLINQNTANYFKEELARKEKAIKSAKFNSKLVHYIGIPLLILSGLHAYFLETEEMHHIEEHGVDHKMYSHLHVYNVKFPFGDGTHSLFFNPKVNYDPKKAS